VSHDEIRNALEPMNEARAPFAAKSRKTPARVAAPSILHFSIRYRQWDGPPLPFSEDFGKKGKQVYSRDGADPVRSCNEVEVAKRLRQIRDHAFWISSYAPSQIPALWRPWTKGPNEAPDWLLALDGRIRAITNRPTGGIPDVVAWNDNNSNESALLIECKGPVEPFKEGQEDWVSAALGLGIVDQQVGVAVRMFS
jgi:hypothetical protein